MWVKIPLVKLESEHQSHPHNLEVSLQNRVRFFGHARQPRCSLSQTHKNQLSLGQESGDLCEEQRTIVPNVPKMLDEDEDQKCILNVTYIFHSLCCMLLVFQLPFNSPQKWSGTFVKFDDSVGTSMLWSSSARNPPSVTVARPTNPWAPHNLRQVLRN